MCYTFGLPGCTNINKDLKLKREEGKGGGKWAIYIYIYTTRLSDIA
jgi:hypothetical protein